MSIGLYVFDSTGLCVLVVAKEILCPWIRELCGIDDIPDEDFVAIPVLLFDRLSLCPWAFE